MKEPRLPRRTSLGTCSVEECQKPGFTLGLCHTHYIISQKAEKLALQAKLDGEVGLPARIGKNGKINGGPGSGEVGMGRPPMLVPDEPTLKRLRELAGIQCTIDEAAGVMFVDGETLRRFIDRHPEAKKAFEQGQLNGKASLRRMQYIQAKRSSAMAIWLGKNYLKQTDALRLGPLSGNRQADDLGIEPPTALLRAVQEEKE
jgi:hypothetical protein